MQDELAVLTIYNEIACRIEIVFGREGVAQARNCDRLIRAGFVFTSDRVVCANAGDDVAISGSAACCNRIGVIVGQRAVISKLDIAAKIDSLTVGRLVAVTIGDGRARRQRDLAIGKADDLVFERSSRCAWIISDRMIDRFILINRNCAVRCNRNIEDRVASVDRSRVSCSRTNDHTTDQEQIDGIATTGQTRHAVCNSQTVRQDRSGSAISASSRSDTENTAKVCS